jgi:hypothetical protein
MAAAQEIGARRLRSSIYVLPNTDACAANFEEVRQQVRTLRGTAVVFVADTVDAADSERLIELFRRASGVEYRRLSRDIGRLRTALARGSRAGPPPNGRQRRALRRLHERREDVERRDFFLAEGRVSVLAAIERLKARAVATTPEWDAARPIAHQFQGRTWVTRPRPGVDRMASAWLIRGFIDPGATFAFGHEPVAGQVSFDMPDADFTHQGSMCTFETLTEQFHINHPAVRRLAQLVHALDLKDGRFDLPEAAAVERLITGLRTQPTPDATLLEHGIALFDALASSLGSAAVHTGGPRTARQAALHPVSTR